MNTGSREEHVWVEAAIDFYPSRGAVNKSADSWVALDGSFKQYEDLQGLDVIADLRPRPRGPGASVCRLRHGQ